MIHPDADLAEYTSAQFKREIAQHPRIEIRADFPRKSFCLYVNGEAVGASSQYKAVWLAKQFLMGERI